MAGWLERVLNGSITSYFGYSVRPSKHRHAESPALLTKPKRTEIALCDETLRKIIRSLYGEPKRTVEDILSLSMTCKRIRSLCNEPALWRDLCILHYQAPPRPVEAVPWRRLYQYNFEMFQCAFTREGSQTYGSNSFSGGNTVRVRA